MINIQNYAEQIQYGLNNALSNENPTLAEGYEFFVAPDIARYKKAERKGNTVVTYINCLLTSSPSANGTVSNGLVLAVDNMTLQILVPTQQIRASVGDVTESVSVQGVYVFVEAIKSLVNDYFKTNGINSYEDEEGRFYEVGFEYSLSRTGESGNLPVIGEFVPFYVYINVNLVQNGVNSKNVTLEMDGEVIPFQVLTPNRASEKSIAVYSDGSAVTRTLMTASTLAFDVSLPATMGTITEQFNDYLLNGKPNVMHFIRFKFGKDESMSKYYLMTFGDVSTQIEGVKNAGLTLPLVEIGFEPDLMNLPDYMQVHKIPLESPTDTVAYEVNTGNKGFIVAFGSNDIKRFEDTVLDYVTQYHTFSEEEVVYDEESGVYYGYIIVCPLDKEDDTDFVYDIKSNISGFWVFNDTLNIPKRTFIKQAINFKSDNDDYYGMLIQSYGVGSSWNYNVGYYTSSSLIGMMIAYNSGFSNNAVRTIDFGDLSQLVSSEFYNWLIANAKKQE